MAYVIRTFSLKPASWVQYETLLRRAGAGSRIEVVRQLIENARLTREGLALMPEPSIPRGSPAGPADAVSRGLTVSLTTEQSERLDRIVQAAAEYMPGKRPNRSRTMAALIASAL